MRKIVLIFSALFTLILSSYITPSKSYASHDQPYEMAVRAVHNNGSTNWEVAYKIWYRTLPSGNRNTTGNIWFVWTNTGGYTCPPALSPYCFDHGNNPTEFGPRYGVTSNAHPQYTIQWGTTCIDPKERAVFQTDNDSGVRYVLFMPVVTFPYGNGAYGRSGGQGANNTGRNISYAYARSGAISGRTDQCPFPPPQPTYSIDGNVFIDDNRDGNRDGGEAWWNSGNQPIDKWGDYYENTGTNSNGYYRFFNLPSRSDYGVRLNVPNGWVCTSANNCRVGCQSQGCGNSGINLPPSRTYNFGIAPPLRPDLDITSFTFPGGCANGTSDPTVIIRNTGNQTITNNFVVRVNNGNGGIRNHTVTQNVSPGESINLSGQFTNMPRPNPGGYTARATVDVNDNINESNENNNAANDAYNTTACLPDLDITAFRFPGGIDTGTSDATVTIRNIGNTDITADFIVTVDSIQGPGGTTQPWNVTQTVFAGGPSISHTFTGMARPIAGNYTALATADSGNDINEEDETNNTATDPYTTTLPPTYSISGGIFVDNDLDGIREATDENGRKDAGEDYRAGRIRIAGVDYDSTVANGFNNIGGNPGERFFFEGTYRVTYTNPPATGYRISYPLNGSPRGAPYVDVTVGPGCTPRGGDSRCVGGNIRDLNFGIAPIIADPWIQAVGGDFRMDINGYRNVIPNALGSGNTCVGNLTRGFVSSDSVPPGRLSKGVVFTGTTPIFTESGRNADSKATPPPGWLVAGNAFTPARPKTIKTSYAYIKAAIDKARIDTNPMIGSSANRACNQGGGPNCTFRPASELSGIASGAFTHTRTVTLPSQGPGGTYTFPAGQDFVFLINGNLNINTNIDVPAGSTAMFIVSGNITIDPSVARIEGIFSADDNFTITPGGSNNPLVVEGSVIANANYPGGTITNGRDLDTFNNTCPAFRVVARPDFILNGPELLRFPVSIISEVAPQGGN